MKRTTGDYEAATFIVRLWREPQTLSDSDPVWRGTAQHVQSGTERGIHDWDSLLQFMASWLGVPSTAPDDDK